MARKSSVPERLRRLVQERAQRRCEYCLIYEADMYYPHEADYVIAEKHGVHCFKKIFLCHVTIVLLFLDLVFPLPREYKRVEDLWPNQHASVILL